VFTGGPSAKTLRAAKRNAIAKIAPKSILIDFMVRVPRPV
jgi:hypothetical protein